MAYGTRRNSELEVHAGDSLLSEREYPSPHVDIHEVELEGRGEPYLLIERIVQTRVEVGTEKA
jgi:hypothetical protein